MFSLKNFIHTLSTFKKMDFFLKEHVSNTVVLQSYNDYSRKVVMQRKYNQCVVLAKANPTSKTCEKFLINMQLELKVELIPLLINVLRAQTSAGPEREEFVIVGECENWKKEVERLVLRTSEYGSREILLQKKSTILPEEDMVFTDDAEPSNYLKEPEEEVEWIDQYGSFYIKKTDDVGLMVKGLNLFYSNVETPGKKRKNVKKPKEIDGVKKTKSKDNSKVIVDEMEDECESVFFLNEEKIYIELINNERALLELCYFYDVSGLSLENCILCYHDQLDESINIRCGFKFFSLLVDLSELEKIETILNKILKRNLFFFRKW